MANESPAKLLGKVLRLERSGGCQDRATTGGMAEVMFRWLPPVTACAPQQQAEVLSQLEGKFHTYSDLSPQQRADLVDQALDLLQGLEAD